MGEMLELCGILSLNKKGDGWGSEWHHLGSREKFGNLERKFLCQSGLKKHKLT